MKKDHPYNLLKEQKSLLVREFNSLLSDYRGLQSFFKDSTPSEAESRFYNYMYNLLEVGPYEEGKFSLQHRSLKTRMKENRKERNELTIKIREIKDLMKFYNQRINQVKNYMYYDTETGGL